VKRSTLYVVAIELRSFLKALVSSKAVSRSVVGQLVNQSEENSEEIFLNLISTGGKVYGLSEEIFELGYA